MKIKDHKKRWLLLLAAVVTAAAALLITRRGPEAYATIGMQQAAAYRHTGPPPWPEGNGFWVKTRSTIWWDEGSSWIRQRWGWVEHLPGVGGMLSPGHSDGWFVANMHAENFNAFCQQQGIRWVKVERYGQSGCLVVDERVPREWLLTHPGSEPTNLKLRLERPECFKTSTNMQALLDTHWKLVEREDPDGWLKRLLPGERLMFEDVNLRCWGKETRTSVNRLWRVGSGNPVYLVTYDFKEEDNSWSGINVMLEREGDSMTFTLIGTSHGDNSGSSAAAYPPGGARSKSKATRATYRRLRADDL